MTSWPHGASQGGLRLGSPSEVDDQRTVCPAAMSRAGRGIELTDGRIPRLLEERVAVTLPSGDGGGVNDQCAHEMRRARGGVAGRWRRPPMTR